MVEQVQGGQDVSLRKQQVGAFEQRFQIAGPVHHEGGPVLFRAGAVALGKPCQAAVVKHPGVVWGELGGVCEAFLRRVVALQFEVDFAELVMERVLVRFGLDASHQLGVGILEVALEQMRLGLEVGHLRVFAVGDVPLGPAVGQGGQGRAAGQPQGRQPNPNPHRRPASSHPRGLPRVE